MGRPRHRGDASFPQTAYGRLSDGYVQRQSVQGAWPVRHLGKPAVIAQRIAGDWSCDDTTFEQIVDPADSGKELLRKPYPFCLASPLQEEVSTLGSADDWQVEWKWDGIRAQFLSTSGGSGMLWSRGEEAIEDCFPEILACLPHLPEELCLDGEILSWGHQGLRSFSRLQKRLGRKNPRPSLVKKEGVRFQVYDLLRIKGEDLRELPMEDRRERLGACSKIPDYLPIGLSPLVKEKSWGNSKREKGIEKAWSGGVHAQTQGFPL